MEEVNAARLDNNNDVEMEDYNNVFLENQIIVQLHEEKEKERQRKKKEDKETHTVFYNQELKQTGQISHENVLQMMFAFLLVQRWTPQEVMLYLVTTFSDFGIIDINVSVYGNLILMIFTNIYEIPLICKSKAKEITTRLTKYSFNKQIQTTFRMSEESSFNRRNQNLNQNNNNNNNSNSSSIETKNPIFEKKAKKQNELSEKKEREKKQNEEDEQIKKWRTMSFDNLKKELKMETSTKKKKDQVIQEYLLKEKTEKLEQEKLKYTAMSYEELKKELNTLDIVQLQILTGTRSKNIDVMIQAYLKKLDKTPEPQVGNSFETLRPDLDLQLEKEKQQRRTLKRSQHQKINSAFFLFFSQSARMPDYLKILNSPLPLPNRPLLIDFIGNWVQQPIKLYNVSPTPHNGYLFSSVAKSRLIVLQNEEYTSQWNPHTLSTNLQKTKKQTIKATKKQQENGIETREFLINGLLKGSCQCFFNRNKTAAINIRTRTSIHFFEMICSDEQYLKCFIQCLEKYPVFFLKLEELLNIENAKIEQDLKEHNIIENTQDYLLKVKWEIKNEKKF